jgi:hypothetical protein
MNLACHSVLLAHKKDNVLTSLRALPPGSLISLAGQSLVAQGLIPAFHKIARTNLSPGQAVIKYGEPIGLASRPIEAGEHVHVHNLESARGRGDLPMPSKALFSQRETSLKGGQHE